MCRTPVVWIGTLLCALALAACGSDGSGTRGAGASGGSGGAGGVGGSGGSAGTPDYSMPGPASVGVTTTSLTDDSRGRTLPVEIWYPIAAAGTASDVIDFETDVGREAALSPLLDAAPSECVATTTNATRDASASAGTYPVILYSHCYTCTRWSAHAVMERLASHGFIVVAPDHEGDTLFDRLNGTASPLNNAIVDVREADIRFVLDQMLGGDTLPEGVTADASKVGMLGHSIGSVTAGRVAQNDARIAAVVGLAAPMENILYGEVLMESITVPLGLLEASEDNSIGVPGNLFIGENFSKANTPAYKLDIIDAGHWSVTNIAGLDEFFEPGCGDDLRQTNGEPFTYLPVKTANGFTATFVTAFFAGHLQDEPGGLELIRSNPWPTEAPIQVREP